MKYSLHLIALLLLFTACNNGDYTTNPDLNTNSNNNLNCSIAITDTVCSCTDSSSWYADGVLESVSYTPWAQLDTPGPGVHYLIILDTGTSSAGNHPLLMIRDYNGPGTYTMPTNQDGSSIQVFSPTHSYDSWHDCTGGKITVIADANGFISGTYYGVLYDPNNPVYISLKGGHFIAKWMN